MKKIQNAFISVFNKDNLKPLVEILNSFDVKLFSSGGTKLSLEQLGSKVTSVEEITNYQIRKQIVMCRAEIMYP